MNTSKYFRLSTSYVYYFLMLSILILASCSKSNDLASPAPDASAVGVVHASAGSPAFDVAFDNNRLGVSYFNYTSRIDYFRAYTGNRSFKVYALSGSNSEPVLTKNLEFVKEKYYTVFIVGSGSSLDAVSLRDSTRAAGQDSVRLRFANMSPDAPGLDLYIKGENDPVATNVTYKTAGNFVSHLAGTNVVFELRPTGQSTLLATMDEINLTRGSIYTIWTGGSINGDAAAGTRIRLEAFAH